MPPWHLQTVVHETMACPVKVARASITSLLSANHTGVLGKIDAVNDLPTLLVWGEHDMLNKPRRQQLSGALVGSRVVVIANAGHSAQWEKPAAFARYMVLHAHWPSISVPYVCMHQSVKIHARHLLALLASHSSPFCALTG